MRSVATGINLNLTGSTARQTTGTVITISGGFGV
jgi:hypothetical protein